MKVLFLCHGNVNRSPAAEIMARQLYPQHEYKSAGLKTKDGRITAKRMRECLTELGYPTEGIRSSVCTQELVDWADQVFYMDDANARRFQEQFPNDVSKARKLSDYIAGINKIPDPAFAEGTRIHRQVINLIRNALEIWTIA